MRKAIFLDRDGTINVEKNYIYRKEEFIFLPNVIDALRKLQDNDFILIIITNQSGIARGYYTEEEFLELNRWMLGQLKEECIYVTDVLYCPHHPDAVIWQYRKECNCRKPGTELFWEATRKYNIDLSQSYAIGDKIRDCAICKESKCRGFLIGKNEDEHIIAKIKQGRLDRIEYQENLLSCTERISVF